MRVIWNERVGSLESEFSMRVGEEEEDVENVAMVDKIEVTLHVSINGISPQLALMTYLKLSPMSLILVTYPQDATDVIYFQRINLESDLKFQDEK